MTSKDYEAHKEDYKDHNLSSCAFVLIQDVYIKILEVQLKAKDEEIERLKEIINASIEEIEDALIKPQYAEVYLNNAIRFLKDNK